MIPPLQDNEGAINSIDFHRSEDLLVTASDDDSIHVYRTSTGEFDKVPLQTPKTVAPSCHIQPSNDHHDDQSPRFRTSIGECDTAPLQSPNTLALYGLKRAAPHANDDKHFQICTASRAGVVKLQL